MESELVSTEEVVNALLEYLVGPKLPLKSSALKEPPTLSQRQSLAKQLHAVVLLYNYYQRKQNPQAQYLDFESFCKLAMTLKPALMSYMKFVNQSDPTSANDMNNDLSVTEKAIQDACNISCSLDASKDAPSINKWLISKVSVLLLDSKKETCFLNYGSVTEGVWSLIEKCLELPTAEIEGTEERRKRRTSMRPVTVEQNDDDSGFQQLAFLAVKDAMGISKTDLVILEKHVVYSLTKEKTASCFYIMQCTRSIDQDALISVKEIFESLQGPLVKRNSGGWSATEVVEYFHLLPYASIISTLFLSATGVNFKCLNDISNKVQHENSRDYEDSTVKELHTIINHPRTPEEKTEELVDYEDSTVKELHTIINHPRTPEEKTEELVKSTKGCEINDDSDMELAGAHLETLEVKINDGYHIYSSPTRPQRMDIDGRIPCSKSGNNSKDCELIKGVYHYQKKRTRESGGKIIGSGIICKAEKADEMKHEPMDIGNLQSVLASKEEALTKSSLEVLLLKRQKLYDQQLKLGDEIASCDKSIERILDGGKGSLALKLDTILDFCDEMCLKDRATLQEDINQPHEEFGFIQPMSGRKLSKAARTP